MTGFELCSLHTNANVHQLSLQTSYFQLDIAKKTLIFLLSNSLMIKISLLR
jgi:hypothetical protein